MNAPIKAIITGTTGMVGEGVMHQCLQNNDVSEVLIINRKPSGYTHPKLKEIVHADFFDWSAIESQFTGYNACYFCLGISSVGVSKEDYYKTTYSLTLSFAKTLAKQNPDMVFCYISGAGTDSLEKGTGWAAVKGKTENEIIRIFKNGFAFRPGFIKPIKGLTKTHSFYKYINWLYPLGRALYPAGFTTLQELAAAMVQVTKNGYSKRVVEGKDIIALAEGF
jgi:hypothetical protein